MSLCLNNASLTPTNWQRVSLVKTLIYVFVTTASFVQEQFCAAECRDLCMRTDKTVTREGTIKCLAHKPGPDGLLLHVFKAFFIVWRKIQMHLKSPR